MRRSSAVEVEPVETGVGVVVAADGQEEAVQRGADVGRVESWSGEIARVAGSSIRAAAVDRSFFQSEVVEFSHRFCQLICLKIDKY